MGEVFEAHDSRLRRSVALKVLSSQYDRDAASHRRLEREARTIAALNHPNICGVYDVGREGDTTFIVMELVEGRSMDVVLESGRMPLSRALRLAIQLTDAVAAAHAQGITHRDLKPSNVMVGPGDHVKVLDFGIAKLTDPLSPADTTASLTHDGGIIGTPRYMSPEQAEGRSVDYRSDVFSIGMMLYEMCSGEHPFKGESTMATLTAIVSREPRPVTEVDSTLPADLNRIIRRCLAKDADRRYQSVKDLRLELVELLESLDLPRGPVASPPSGTSRFVLIGAAVGAVSVAILVLWPRIDAPPGPTPTFSRVSTAVGLEHSPRISPDGEWILYVAQLHGDQDILLKNVAGERVINLTPDSSADDSEPAISPDGGQIVFRSERDGGGLFLMGRTGESVRRLTSGGFNPVWSPDGRLVLYATERVGVNPYGRLTTSELWTADVRSGESQRLYQGDAVQPSWSPDGMRIAFWASFGQGRSGQRDILTIPAGGGSPVAVTNDAATDWNPVWSADSSSLYFSSDRGGSMNIWQIAVDSRSGIARGTPTPITAPSPFTAALDLSRDGRWLAFSSVDSTSRLYRVGFEPTGGQIIGEPALLTLDNRLWYFPDVSPDGGSLVFATGRQQEDIYVSNADGTSVRRLTDDEAYDRVPRWAPDGRRVAFFSTRNGSIQLWTILADGSRLTPLTAMEFAIRDPVWSPDGRRLAVAHDAASGSIVYIIDAANGRLIRQLPAPLGTESRFLPWSWSANGTKLAGYDGTGLVPTAGIGGGIVIHDLESGSYHRLTDDGVFPRWLSDGRRLLYTSGKKLLLLDTLTGATKGVLTAEGAPLAAISRDDRFIFYSAATTEGDVWLMRLQ